MLIDNKKEARLGDVLGSYIKKGSKLSIVSTYFTIYAFDKLKKSFLSIDKLKLLLSTPFDSNTNNPIFGDSEEIKFRNSLRQIAIAKECEKWIEDKVEVKEANYQGLIPFNLYILKNKQDVVAIQGSSNFSSVGLGYIYSPAFSMNTLYKDSNSIKSFESIFDDIWNDKSKVTNIKNKVIDSLAEFYQEKSPQFLYFVTLYNIFKDFLNDLEEENIIKTKTGFKDTKVWNMLYNFQRDGVVWAIDKLEKYNGCIIADSVGLGKTFEALAVIKYYELRNDRVLVLCPKKLRDNWTIYTINDKRNILASDRFNYDILNHTDLSRPKGMSGDIDLATLNWENYDLVVIDESHNFRNSATTNKKSLRKSRYEKLLEDVLKKGVKTKVLMLSATPVNSKLNDLKNQLAFITEGKDDALNEHGIKSIGQTLRIAQTKFNYWMKLSEKSRTTKELLDSLNFDYFKLLDLLTIARSRKHIQKYYDTKSLGKFPKRNKPITLKPDIDIEDNFPPLKNINTTIRKLNLSAYSPLKYLLPHLKEVYAKKYDIDLGNGRVFKQTDRENSIIHLMRVNMLKRMESSINSFSITLRNLIKTNKSIINKLNTNDSFEVDEESILDIDLESQDLASQLVGNKVKVLIKDVDKIRWLQDLQSDLVKLEELLNISLQIDASRDKKLKILKDTIKNKIKNPLNPNNKKVIIFTAFADTAEYLYSNINKWAKKKFGIDCALIVGSGSNKTTFDTKHKDLNSLLTHFSPVSKSREKIFPDAINEIDILIATDCISEGQNLQDCDCLVNYDIHWNPVRIVQRFGRIDRLGSKNSTIQLINFWPNMELDEYINLESRVSGRMVLLDVSATGEENIIDTDSSDKMNDLSYRAKQLKELQENVIDLEDVNGTISLTDLTLNDFKMDLSNYIKTDLDKLTKTPLGIHSVVKSQDTDMPKGVIFCFRLLKEQQLTQNYSLEPYYLVYIKDDGEINLTFSNAKAILDIYKTLSLDKTTPQNDAISCFKNQTKEYQDMSKYTQLLKKATQSIIGKKEEVGTDSLFFRGGTTISADNLDNTEDFELITYLVIS